MIYPKFLEANDTIGVFAPSAGVGGKTESFQKSIDNIKANGYKVIETKSVRNIGQRSNTKEIRCDEFHSLLENKDVKLIIAATGGDYNLEMLPCIKDEFIMENPKWFMGYSDPTAISYYITTKFDIATMYGRNAGSFDQIKLHKSLNDTFEIMKGNLICQNSFEKYESLDEPLEGEYNLKEEVYWQLINGEKDNQGNDSLDVSGRLIGGCLELIQNIIGTKYDFTKEFLDRYNDNIWFLDVFAMNAAELLSALLHMKFCGYFQKTKAIIIGRVMFSDSTLEEYLAELSREIDLPIIFNADIGHVKPTMTLINGSMAELKVIDGKGSLKMELK